VIDLEQQRQSLQTRLTDSGQSSNQYVTQLE